MMPPQQTPRNLAETNDWDEEELSDEQMKRLLQQAEQRLLENAGLNKHNTEIVALHNIPKLDPGPIAQPYITSTNGVARADPRRLMRDEDRRLSDRVKTVEDPVIIKKNAARRRNQTLGSHFDMPRTILDNALKADLSLLKLRGVLDPRQHYKKESSKNLVSDYSEVGRITEGPLEYKTRAPNRERKRTFVEEVLANESLTGRFKNKYNEIQSSKTNGKRAYYKKLKGKRLGAIGSS